MSPGPTPVPDKVRLRMAETLIHHRTPRFRSILKNVHAKLKEVFRTENPVLVLASSGTGAMEAAVVNLLSKGDKALVVNGGKFGERFGVIARQYGIGTVDYNVEWGQPADPDEIDKILKENDGIKAVFTTLAETSTGVVNDIRSIGEVVAKTDSILVVDAISGLTADRFLPDEWGVDAVVCGSQKGFMLPPGLGFISLSHKAQKMVERSDLPKYYFDLKSALDSHGKEDTPWTPGISLILGLDSVLDMLLDEGMDNVLARHAFLADLTREAVKAIGLEILASRPSNAVTAVKVPEGMDASEVVKKMRDEQGITIAGGQGALKGKIFRLGHLGHMDAYDTISTIAALEIVLKQLGYAVELGSGVSKAQEILIQEGDSICLSRC